MRLLGVVIMRVIMSSLGLACLAWAPAAVAADTLAFRPRGFGCADVHPPIDLHAVDREDGCTQFLGHTHRYLALSGGGRTEDRNEPSQTG